ncbi:phosphoglucosamine mutase [Raineya orbicola]|uniref:Phosphoglucosamine mutase n=1 Tax=Raineya orbicola TaxID=2016530 RepID=A0A2N3IAD1_9BACT|nr:phosphoglucosamine mutase [Raineya orbicola]PKQ67245.1 Phosphoglucosamine mutase [Raineya orbicola]
MTLIQSISGIRGTIGGKVGENLTPVDIVRFTAAFGTWLKSKNAEKNKVVIGRDARISGLMLSQLVSATLQGLGIDVVDLGLATTPTVEIAVPEEGAIGGIILTASHNPLQWNALKLLNSCGEFISAKDGEEVLEIAQKGNFEFAEVKKLGSYSQNNTYLQKHIEKILALPLVDVEAIRQKNFKIAVDAVNSVGGIAVPALLKALGVIQITEFNCEPTGHFAHNSEPLPENLIQFSKEVERGNFDLGIVVDPDVDRLAFICDNGEPFGEEYTLVAVADYVLKHQKGNTVSNLSSTQALRIITQKHGQTHFASAVGEVNVVSVMKQTKAVIGGEGNGGVIYPALHYGRDALVGIALFLSHLAKFGKSASILRATYPKFYMSKNKIELYENINVDEILEKMQRKYAKFDISTIDGLKVNFDNAWVHLRKSNTEPIIRIYAEADTQQTADNLTEKVILDIRELSK